MPGAVLEAVGPDRAGVDGQQFGGVERVAALEVVHQVLLDQKEAQAGQPVAAYLVGFPQPGEEGERRLRVVASRIGQVGGVDEAEEELSALLLQELSDAGLLVALALGLLEHSELGEDVVVARECLEVVGEEGSVLGAVDELVAGLAVLPLGDLVVDDWDVGGVELVIEEVLLEVGEGEQEDLVQLAEVLAAGQALEPLVLPCHQLL